MEEPRRVAVPTFSLRLDSAVHNLEALNMPAEHFLEPLSIMVQQAQIWSLKIMLTSLAGWHYSSSIPHKGTLKGGHVHVFLVGFSSNLHTWLTDAALAALTLNLSLADFIDLHKPRELLLANFIESLKVNSKWVFNHDLPARHACLGDGLR